MDALAAKLNLPKEPVYLPLDVQREVLLCAMERETYLCPKDNGKNMRNRAQLLSELSLVCREWKEMADPLLYANVSLPTLTHLQRFTRTLAVHPDYGIWTRYFHYFGPIFPARFLPEVFYHLPNLEHFLTQADATTIKDEDIDGTKPRPKLLTLEIDPGVHDQQGRYRDAGVERWCELGNLRSLALVGLEAINNVLPTNTSFPNLIELHLMHQEDDLDDDPDSSHLIVSILRHVGPQLHLLRIDEFSSDILPAPKEIFTYCPNLVTLSVSGFDLKPLVDQGHPYLRNWLLGDPWNYHNEQAEVSVQIESCEKPGTSSFSSGWGGAAEVVKHRITEDDRDAALDVLSADKDKFPSLEVVLLWNVSFKEEENRSNRLIKEICDAFAEKTGWRVGDRYAVGRDSSWEVQEGNPDLGWVQLDEEEDVAMN